MPALKWFLLSPVVTTVILFGLAIVMDPAKRSVLLPGAFLVALLLCSTVMQVINAINRLEKRVQDLERK